jgi:hypothetical protein
LTAVERIEERFKAMEAGLSSEVYTPRFRPAIYKVPAKDATVFAVGMRVAMFHNPMNSGRVVAISGDVLHVQRGGNVVEIVVEKCVALIPLSSVGEADRCKAAMLNGVARDESN